jgi:hypothetical protein
MDLVRIIHREEPGQGWWYTSTDLGVTGGEDTYAASRMSAEKAVRLLLEWAAAQHGAGPPRDVRIEHYVHESALQRAAS